MSFILAIPAAFLIGRWVRSYNSTHNPFSDLARLVENYKVHIERVANCEALLIDSFVGIPGMALGFDIEWKPPNNRTTLIQLATEHTVVLLQLTNATELPKPLITLLEDDRILKAGVGIRGDAAKLGREFGVAMRGCIDLQLLAAQNGYQFGGNGLKVLGKELLGIEMVANHPVRSSDWEQQILTDEQVVYAAADAIVGRQILLHLFKTHGSGDITAFSSGAMDAVSGYVPPVGSTTSPQQKLRSGYRAPTRQRPLYHNCQLLSPAGVLLCNCDERKIAWYAARELVDIIQQEPIVVAKLRFEPQGLGRSGDDFYLAPKRNICVACGTDKDLIRHAIVPAEYRREFPLELKSHKSHDVVLLCIACQGKLQAYNDKERQRLAVQFNAPLSGVGSRRIVDQDRLKAKRFAALLLLQTDEVIRGEAPLVDTKTEFAQTVAHRIAKLPAVRSCHPLVILPAVVELTVVPRIMGTDPGEVQQLVENFIKEKIQQQDVEVRIVVSPTAPPGVAFGGKPIPPERITEMIQFVCQTLSTPTVDRATLQQLVDDADAVTENPNFISHAELVVRGLKTVAAINAFVRSWRQSFLDHLDPQHLPDHWNVDYEEHVFDVKDPAERRRGRKLCEAQLEDAVGRT